MQGPYLYLFCYCEGIMFKMVNTIELRIEDQEVMALLDFFTLIVR